MVFIGFLSALQVRAQTNILSARDTTLPSELQKFVSGRIIRTSTIDFDGDGRPDYIVEVEIPRDPASSVNPNPYAYEYWFTSRFKLVKKTPRNIDDYYFMWFANLGRSKQPYVILAEGFSDGIDYAVYGQDFTTGRDTLLFRFYPVLLNSIAGKRIFHWGYPWDISDLLLKDQRGIPLIHCSFDTLKNADEGTSDMPSWQRRVPILFFSGKSTQESDLGEIQTLSWLSLDQILEQCHKGTR